MGTEVPSGMGGVGWGGDLYLMPSCRCQNDLCVKVGSDADHFNVSLTAKSKVTRQCPETTTFGAKKEKKKKGPKQT